ncbi:MAG: cupin domain-containing protein [Croceivirga sp.]
MSIRISISLFFLVFMGCQDEKGTDFGNGHKKTAADWIMLLQLEKHPEGGYYRRTYQSQVEVPQDNLPKGYKGSRVLGTAIYFLLEKSDFSAFHKLRQDEMWHFYEGATLHLHTIDTLGNYNLIKLGRNPEEGEVLQYLVKGETYFASELIDKKAYALVGCTVTPGFDFNDFEMPSQEVLMTKYPQYSEVIKTLTRH